jgi:DNA-binding transcriptional ArsR family regulator
MDTFLALADPTRRSILELLAQSGQLAASEIAARFNITPSAISQHLKVLKEARLVKMSKKAQSRIYKLDVATISQIERWTNHLQQR